MPQSPSAPEVARPRRTGRRVLKALAVLLVVLLLAVLGTGVWLRSRLHASLPQLRGERAVAGLSAPVTVERDALGVPWVRGANRLDVARATGFVHAQERFFQMDLARRAGAGELAELLGPALVPADRVHRLHRFRTVAGEVLARSRPEERAVIEAYTAGVNAGLQALGAPPFEYLALRAAPAPWQAADSILVVFAMYFQLNDFGGFGESNLGLLHDLLPPQLADFLAPVGTELDAPIAGEPLATPPIPGPEVLDLRRRVPQAAALPRRPVAVDDDRLAPLAGSNNWAVAGAHTADGHALLANDMHLGLGIPNTWYRASLGWPQGGEERRVTGVMLPGTPAVAVGSNGHVAWGYTNNYGDWSDLVVLEVDPKDKEVYRTPAGPRRFDRYPERIRVHGGKDVVLDVWSTIWGPVVGSDHRGRPRALAWIAHHPEAVGLGILGLEDVRTVDQAIAVAHRTGIPPQNFVVADETGRIGWTTIGRIPRRVGFDGRLPTSWADGARRWEGWLAPGEVPQVVDPPSGRLWTANNRVVGGDMLARLGDGGYDLGARARQIRDDLLARERVRPADLLAIQLDDRALWLERWRALLLTTLTPETVKGNPRRAELRRLVATRWSGHAAVDSVGYRLVRGFHNVLAEQVFDALTAPCRAADKEFGPTRQFEGPLWKLVTERPPHLLDPRFASWDEQILAAVDGLLDSYQERPGTLTDRSWGEVNTVFVRHPLSRAVPVLARWLDMAPRALPGDENMPRVQHAFFGASERLVVSPGHEENGLFHMPGGESGHPLSPHYGDGHRAWEEGRPTPFLPGPAVDTLRLVPP
jgi:penicillin G amidase